MFLNEQKHLVCQEELYEVWNYYRGPFRTDDNFSGEMIEPCKTFMSITYNNFEKYIDESIDNYNIGEK